MKKFNNDGEFIHPDEIKNGSYRKFILCLMDNNFIDLYTSLDLIQLITVLTEYEFNIIYNEYGDKEVISRKHIVKISEVK